MKQKKGGGLFLFTHLTVERCPFLFIYLGMILVAKSVNLPKVANPNEVRQRGTLPLQSLTTDVRT